MNYYFDVTCCGLVMICGFCLVLPWVSLVDFWCFEDLGLHGLFRAKCSVLGTAICLLIYNIYILLLLWAILIGLGFGVCLGFDLVAILGLFWLGLGFRWWVFGVFSSVGFGGFLVSWLFVVDRG